MNCVLIRKPQKVWKKIRKFRPYSFSHYLMAVLHVFIPEQMLHDSGNAYTLVKGIIIQIFTAHEVNGG